MNGSRTIFAASIMLTVACAQTIASPCKPADAKLAGGYELRGVRETGSVIALEADGRFGYMLTVGAFDEVARGCWRREGDAVVLNPTDIRANSGDPSFKKALKLPINAKGGLVRYHEGKKVGVYERFRK